MSDPYDLLRRAEVIIREQSGPGRLGWLADFKKLPGAKLTKKAVRVLRDPHRRMRGINQDVVEQLLEDGYLREVSNVRRHGTFTQIRLSQKGREALRLREDVTP
jgi:hypothetical protein